MMILERIALRIALEKCLFLGGGRAADRRARRQAAADFSKPNRPDLLFVLEALSGHQNTGHAVTFSIDLTIWF
jgi:hypothetical protein